jgi:hypothetical protein
MTQQQIEAAVCLATGEDLCEIQRLGFSLADPVDVDFDPEPYEAPSVIDWDALDLTRQVALLPERPFQRIAG